ncbi:chemotaxis protein CheW [Chitinilyticum piscinae]|uniref:Chemotaxis protein CheW n=1 Tax=Chitinilyticum piscinae TaxID=2866724 RepID=A0A8J7FK97_9NEIS|nr:chemotaxis protein CheW [Chitinilyticum piscinae]MBE9609210.1 chemotaxis protein CheW [Chitinilyticum piscinae]
MSKRVSLREYQEGVVARLQTATTVAQVDARLGVQIGAQNWLVDLADVAEVMPVPAVASVPLAQGWFRGVANIRGNLVSVADAAAFFGEPPLVPTPASRLLLIQPRLLPHASILVSRMLGLKHLADLEVLAEDNAEKSWQGQVYRDAAGVRWNALKMDELAQSPVFLQVGIA